MRRVEIEKAWCDVCEEVIWPHLHIIPMDEILEFESCDAGAYGGYQVKDCLEGKSEDEFQMTPLLNLILSEGFRHGYAPATELPDSNYVRDGHHRITALYKLGAKWCPWQRQATHGEDTEEYEREKEEMYRERFPAIARDPWAVRFETEQPAW